MVQIMRCKIDDTPLIVTYNILVYMCDGTKLRNHQQWYNTDDTILMIMN